MNGSDQSRRFLDEFRAFLAFLESLWGILTGISIFFPLSNAFTRLIPLERLAEDGALVYFSPALVTAIATLLTLFVVFSTFSSRRNLSKMRLRAQLSFTVGIVALVTYMVLYYVKLEYYGAWGWGSDDPHHFIAEVPLVFAYGAFFASITRAFMLLGMLEFYRKQG